VAVGSTPSSDRSAAWAPSRDADRAAFESLIGDFWDPVMQFFWKRVSPEEAEDLTQEVFVSAYRTKRSGGGPSAADGAGWRRYLLSSARNRVIDHWRRHGVQPPASALTHLVGYEDSTQPPGRPADSTDSGTGRLVSSEQSRAIRECLGELNVIARALCWLVFAESRSKREAARMLRLPESSARGVLVEALKALRRCLVSKGVAPGA